jgi:BirA family transcriptional regulator, biotin operon repressor / biotin---[acetyl-CoA-carboxylase] ligase
MVSDVVGPRGPLDAAALGSQLDPVWQLQVVAETTSTNADLLAAASAGRAPGAVLVAEFQRGGRGRLDRSWVSPVGAGLTFSVLLRPTVPVANWGWLPLLAGLSLQQTIGETAALKWPNDVLLGPDRRKVAGILVQAVDGAAVIGIGLNVSTTRAELPVDTATSLQLEGLKADRAALLVGFLDSFAALLATWQAAGGDAVRSGLADRYRAVCETIGSAVTIQFGDDSVSANAIDIDDDGQLVVVLDGDSAPRPIAAGDVTHVGPQLR